MRRQIAIARVLKKLVPLTAAVVLLTSGGAYPQLGGLNSGINPGMPGASPPVGRSGIPLGAVELGTGGLSPAPLGATSGLAPFGSSIPSNTGVGIGAETSLGSGLSPTPAPSGFPALAPTGTGAGPRSPNLTPNITNYGFGGFQSLPGTSRNGLGRR